MNPQVPPCVVLECDMVVIARDERAVTPGDPEELIQNRLHRPDHLDSVVVRILPRPCDVLYIGATEVGLGVQEAKTSLLLG